MNNFIQYLVLYYSIEIKYILYNLFIIQYKYILFNINLLHLTLRIITLFPRKQTSFI